MNSKQLSKKAYYLLYTVCYAVIALCIYSVFIVKGKSFVYALYGDGHICINSLVYYGEWLRSILRSIFVDHSPSIPMWDMSIGFGSDIFVTLNWETLGDPLNLLAVFFKPEQTEFIYGVIAIFRLYLVGFTYSIYARSHKHKDMAVLMGAIVYAFCGFAIFAGVRDVYFISPMVYMPLLCLGVDRCLEKKKSGLLIAIVFLGAVTNFYFFFMEGVWTFLYGIYRYFQLNGKAGISPKKLIPAIGKCALACAIGAAMACFLLLPIVNQLLGSGRFNRENVIPLTYSAEYYWKLLVRFIDTESMLHWTHLGFAPIAVICVLVLLGNFKKNSRYKTLSIGFVMAAVFLMIPKVGSLMNAGSYVTNRWVWAFSLIVGYIVTCTWDELATLELKQVKIISILASCYAVGILAVPQTRTLQLKLTSLILLLTAATWLIGIVVCEKIKEKNGAESEKHLTSRKNLGRALALCLIIGVIYNGVARFADFGSHYVNGFVNAGQSWDLLDKKLAGAYLHEIDDDLSAVRYDPLGYIEPMNNTAINHDLNGTNMYYSLEDGSVPNFNNETALNVETRHNFRGLDDRSVIEWMDAVKYVIAGEDFEAYVPYGYEEVASDYTLISYDHADAEEVPFTVYKDENTLPLGYTFDSYVSYADYMKEEPIVRQQIMIQSAVVDTEAATNLKVPGKSTSDLVSDHKILDYAFSATGENTVTDDCIDVWDTDSKVTLTFDLKENDIPEQTGTSEVYIYFSGIVYDNDGRTDLNATKIYFERDNSKKWLTFYAPDEPFYLNHDDFLVNLGNYTEAGTYTVDLSFWQRGLYKLDTVYVYAQPMDELVNARDARAQESFTDIKMSNNHISAKLDCSSDKIACMAIPYSKGWSVYVDGVKADTFRVATMYLGFEVSEGQHDIELKYFTPRMKEGIILCILGIITMTALLIFEKRKDKSVDTKG